MAPNLVGASQSMNYSLVNDDPTSEKLPDLDVRIHVESYRNPRVLSFTSYLRHIAVTLQLSFRSLESCPKELYINFFLKFFESYSYFAISQILVLYLHIGKANFLYSSEIVDWYLLRLTKITFKIYRRCQLHFILCC